jgi:hypothetical protein
MRTGDERLRELHTLLLQEALRFGHVLEVRRPHVVGEYEQYIGSKTHCLVRATSVLTTRHAWPRISSLARAITVLITDDKY